jgi:hypothetical protein
LFAWLALDRSLTNHCFFRAGTVMDSTVHDEEDERSSEISITSRTHSWPPSIFFAGATLRALFAEGWEGDFSDPPPGDHTPLPTHKRYHNSPFRSIRRKALENRRFRTCPFLRKPFSRARWTCDYVAHVKNAMADPSSRDHPRLSGLA